MFISASSFFFLSFLSNFSTLMNIFYNERDNRASYYMKHVNGEVLKVPASLHSDGQSHP